MVFNLIKMIIHNVDPVLINLGFAEIRYYSLAYILGIILAWVLLHNAAKKGYIKNLDKHGVEDLIIYLSLGIILGGRLLYFLFYTPATLIHEPLEIFRVWHGGMSFHGGVIGIILAIYFFARKHDINFYAITDRLVMPAAIMLFIGRIANFINAELVGTVTSMRYCIQYKGIEGCRHPSQIYEAVKNLVIFFVLFMIKSSSIKNRKSLIPGTLTWLFGILYGLLRFIVTFYRDDPRFLGLSIGQYLSLALMLVSGFMIIHIKSQNNCALKAKKPIKKKKKKL